MTNRLININKICIGDELSLTAATTYRNIDIKDVKETHINPFSSLTTQNHLYHNYSDLYLLNQIFFSTLFLN